MSREPFANSSFMKVIFNKTEEILKLAFAINAEICKCLHPTKSSNFQNQKWWEIFYAFISPYIHY